MTDTSISLRIEGDFMEHTQYLVAHFAFRH